MTDNTPDPAITTRPPQANESLEDRLNAALAKLGLPTGPELQTMLVEHLEAAADGYEKAVIPADAKFFQAEGVRLLAALHAGVGR